MSQLAKAVDLAPFPKAAKAESEVVSRINRARLLPPAWRGTILPATDADYWLAAAFSDYEKIVAVEKSIESKAKEAATGKNKSHEPDKDAQDKLAIAQFAAVLAMARRHAATGARRAVGRGEIAVE